ncbi:MAG: RidA family protein [Caulobacteraceae bacterium]|nr:RidA family protein [Caulobacteraceae bacterium]
MPPHLSPIVRGAELLFASGQMAFDETGRITGDVSAQTTRCLENLERALQTAGRDRRDILKTTIWLTDPADFAAFNEAYAAFFGDHRPARSTVVAQLVIPGARIEIEAIASDVAAQ